MSGRRGHGRAERVVGGRFAAPAGGAVRSRHRLRTRPACGQPRQCGRALVGHLLRLAGWTTAAALAVVAVQAWQLRGAAEGPAPPLSGPVAAGDPAGVVRRAVAEGRPVLVYFWASWCRICRLSEGAVAAVGRDWPLVTVAMQSGDREAVAAWLRERGHAGWATFADPRGELAARWGVRGVPAYFVVGPDGRIRHRAVGYTTGTGLRLRLWLASRGASD